MVPFTLTVLWDLPVLCCGRIKLPTDKSSLLSRNNVLEECVDVTAVLVLCSLQHTAQLYDKTLQVTRRGNKIVWYPDVCGAASGPARPKPLAVSMTVTHPKSHVWQTQCLCGHEQTSVFALEGKHAHWWEFIGYLHIFFCSDMVFFIKGAIFTPWLCVTHPCGVWSINSTLRILKHKVTLMAPADQHYTPPTCT